MAALRVAEALTGCGVVSVNSSDYGSASRASSSGRAQPLSRSDFHQRCIVINGVTRHFGISRNRAPSHFSVIRAADGESSTSTLDPLSSSPPLKLEQGMVLVDHFGRLGISKSASNAEIMSAYSARCREVTADDSLGEEEFRKKLANLELSLNVLLSEDEKRMYLWTVARMANPNVYSWPYEADPTQEQYTGTPAERPAEDTLRTRNLGYFFLGWFVLSVVLSTTLK